MAAVTVSCQTNIPYDSRDCRLSFKKTCFYDQYVFFMTNKRGFYVFICMATESDSCHLAYLYDNQQ